MKNKIITVILTALMTLSLNATANFDHYGNVEMLGVSFSYNGLFKGTTVEYGGLLAPLNQTETNINNANDEGTPAWHSILAIVAVLAVLASVAGEDDECKGTLITDTNGSACITTIEQRRAN